MSHTNYNAVSNKKPEVKNTIVPETKPVVLSTPEDNAVNTPTTTANPEPVFGFVTGCARLNVRENPNLDAPVLLVIDEDAEVIVVLEESTAEWYKVYANEQEGFCMKKYIEIDE
jgi:hypothetical protein